MAKDTVIIGMDFGTDSVRSVVIDAGTGRELANEVSYYRRWAAGKY
jgi:L-ribulokinase